MKRRQLVSASDVRRAADARALGVARAAEVHRISETAIRRAIRNANEANAIAQIAAMFSTTATEGNGR